MKIHNYQVRWDCYRSHDLWWSTKPSMHSWVSVLSRVSNSCWPDYNSGEDHLRHFIPTSYREKCLSILANLWNAPNGFFGAATTGSSESVLLGGLAMKREWQLNHPNHLYPRPNVIIGANAHVCVNKFAFYFDVEARIIPVSERSGYSLDIEGLEDRLDENTSICRQSHWSF